MSPVYDAHLSALLFFVLFLVLPFCSSGNPVKIKKCLDPKDWKYPDPANRNKSTAACRRCDAPYDGDFCTRENAVSMENFGKNKKKNENQKTTKKPGFFRAAKLQDGYFHTECFSPLRSVKYLTKLKNRQKIEQVDVYAHVKDHSFENYCKVELKISKGKFSRCSEDGNWISQSTVISRVKCKLQDKTDVIRIQCSGSEDALRQLELCEVKVPVSCDPFWWGLETGCSNQCRCQDSSDCDEKTGDCPKGKALPTQLSSVEPTTHPSASTPPGPMHPSTSAPMSSPPTSPELTSASVSAMLSSTSPGTVQESSTSVTSAPMSSPPTSPEFTSALASTMLPLTSPGTIQESSTSIIFSPTSPKHKPLSSPFTTSLSSSTSLPVATMRSTQLSSTSTPLSSSSVTEKSSQSLSTNQGVNKERKIPGQGIADHDSDHGETDEDGLLLVLLGLLAVVLVGAVLAGMFAVRRYKRHKSVSEGLVADDHIADPDLENNITGFNMEMALEPFSVTTDPIPVDAFRDHICRMVRLDGFALEYKALPTGILKEVTAANTINKGSVMKNRFKDISPYDESRVILPKEEGRDCDYINASYINGFNQQMAYIAAQGPLNGTVEDFWRMVWADSCGKIVMLTNLCEQGRSKCEQYWPQEDESSLTIGQFTIVSVSVVEKAHFTHRVLDITKTADQGDEIKITHQIHQFHFTAWPDHGVPCPVALVQFWYYVIHQSTQLTGPMLVHCSAGIGRTGTFIALDMLIQQAKMTNKVSVYPTVVLLRNQRVNMVQTLSQYRFLHEVVKEWLASRDTTVVRTDLTGGSQWTGQGEEKGLLPAGAREKITAQFKALDQLRPSPNDEEVFTAKMEHNVCKNRSSEILPVDQYRVCLWTPDDTVSDYINAVFLPSLVSKQRYIVTQLPLEATVQDFFQMVLDWRINTIVRFMDTPQDEGVTVYPNEGEQVHHGKIRVHTLSKSTVSPGISLYTMHLHSEQNSKTEEDEKEQNDEEKGQVDKETKVKAGNDDEEEDEDLDVSMYCVESAGILKLKDPGEAVALTNTLLPLIIEAVKPPVVLQCFNGVDLSCILCAVMMVREAMQVEDKASPFLCTRLIQSARPQAFKTLEEYEFVFQCLLHCTGGTSDSGNSADISQNNIQPPNETADIPQKE